MSRLHVQPCGTGCITSADHQLLFRASDMGRWSIAAWLDNIPAASWRCVLEVTCSVRIDLQRSSLSPPHTVCEHAGAADAEQQAEALHLASRALILFAVNDNPFVDEADGGTHWTLLAYMRSDRTFSHYDSGHSDSNDAAARGIAAKLAPVLGYDMCNAVTYTSAIAGMPILTGPANCRAVSCRAGYSFTTPNVPKQCNGFDCGMHVLGEYTINNAVAQ
jgi:Ulp1 protease family, C-terminal catalytic domain